MVIKRDYPREQMKSNIFFIMKSKYSLKVQFISGFKKPENSCTIKLNL